VAGAGAHSAESTRLEDSALCAPAPATDPKPSALSTGRGIIGAGSGGGRGFLIAASPPADNHEGLRPALHGNLQSRSTLRRSLLIKVISRPGPTKGGCDSVIELTAAKIVEALQAQSMTIYLVEGNDIAV